MLLKIVTKARNAIRSHVEARLDVMAGCGLADQLDDR
jgi:hypothetical protein